MSKSPSAENDALVGALLWLENAPKDDRIYDIDFGHYSDGTGCWWSMRLVTEIRSGEVVPSPEDDEQKYRKVIEAWIKAYSISLPPRGDRP